MKLSTMRSAFYCAIIRSSSLPPIHLGVFLEPEVFPFIFETLFAVTSARNISSRIQHSSARRRGTSSTEPVEIQVFCELDVGFVVGLG
jgi:hypothetical protein